MEESANDIGEGLNDTEQIIAILKAINRNLTGINQSLKLISNNLMMKK
jgi:hypothetical protein